MPRLPRNLHVVTTSRSPDIAIRTKHAARHVSSAAPATQNDDGGLQNAALATKNFKSSCESDSKVLHLPQKMTFDTFSNRLIAMSQSATPAKQNERTTCLETFEKERMDLSTKVLRLPRKTATHLLKTSQKYYSCHLLPHKKRPSTRYKATRRFKPPKMISFAELTIGTYIRPLCGRLRNVANGCGQLRTVAQRRANTPSTPRPLEWNGNPFYAFGGKTPRHFETASTLSSMVSSQG